MKLKGELETLRTAEIQPNQKKQIESETVDTALIKRKE